MLNLHEVYVFLIAAETENFSETGRRLNISQPAVSMQIRSLEETLGMDLFYRSGRHISLTEAGRTLVPMARDLVSRAIRIEEEMACLRGKIVGVLRLAYSMASGKYIIPRLVAGLRSQHPDVQIVCSVAPRDQSLQMLLNGEVHIAITNLREPSKDIEYRPFATDRIILIAPPGHPWAQRRVIEPADLTECDLILQDEGSGTREALKDKLAWHNLSLDSLRTVMVLSNTEAIRIAVEEGSGGVCLGGCRRRGHSCRASRPGDHQRAGACTDPLSGPAYGPPGDGRSGGLLGLRLCTGERLAAGADQPPGRCQRRGRVRYPGRHHCEGHTLGDKELVMNSLRHLPRWARTAALAVLLACTLAAVTAGLALAADDTAPPMQDDGEGDDRGEFSECAECHPDVTAAWQDGPHDTAFSIEHFQHSWTELNQPQECLACHTTGFSPATGNYQAEGVTCEACHGEVPDGHPPGRLTSTGQTRSAPNATR